MLSPRYLDGLSDEIVEIYAQLEADILQDMARRIARLGKITDATRWQAQLLAEAGALKKTVQRLIKKYDPAVQKEITALYNDAMIKNARADNRIFTEALGHGVSDINAQLMLASIQKTHSDLSRLTITTAYTTEQQFVQQANAAYMQVTTGAFDYDSAMINACDNLARDGITGVQYRNGRPVRLTIEAAVRMNILTGVNQTASAMTMNNCDVLGCDLVETTAHIGARPTHQDWQGQVFSLSGRNKKYRPFSVCHLGEVDGICGINCKHSYYPYFEELGRHYTQDDLDDMAKETVKYNGKTYTRYDAEQKLRGIERNIRRYKRQALTQEAAGQDATRARRKIGEWQAAARDFTEQTKLERDRVREFIGTADGKQPRGIFTDNPPQSFRSAPSNKSGINTNSDKSINVPNIKTKRAIDIDGLVENPKSKIREELEKKTIKKNEVYLHQNKLSQTEIIDYLASENKDPTGGSCASMAFAYVANDAGYNVKDYMGGVSMNVFSTRETMLEIAKFNGVESHILYYGNDIKAANKLYDYIEIGKQYLLSTGNHSAIVKRNENGIIEFLELQFKISRGFNKLTDEILKQRFTCIENHISMGVYSIYSNILIEITSLARNKEFIELLKYINTLE